MKQRKIVAIASSTGGPKALQSVIPKLSQDIDAPILIVQHMPAGFTASLAGRLNGMSEVEVKEAHDGDVLLNGHVYIAAGGKHMVVARENNRDVIRYMDGPAREGVKPSANYMFESLADIGYDKIVCVVMTGMGADGTQGIKHLKEKRPIQVITQDRKTCVIYGMPRSAVKAGLSDEEVALDKIAGVVQKYLEN